MNKLRRLLAAMLIILTMLALQITVALPYGVHWPRMEDIFLKASVVFWSLMMIACLVFIRGRIKERERWTGEFLGPTLLSCTLATLSTVAVMWTPARPIAQILNIIFTILCFCVVLAHIKATKKKC